MTDQIIDQVEEFTEELTDESIDEVVKGPSPCGGGGMPPCAL